MDLGLVADLTAESFGEPGQRTFRLLAETGEGTVSLWLEKEQIVALGAALDELLDRVDGGAAPATSPAPTFIGELEVRAGSLSVGFSRELDSFVFEAGDFTSPFDVETIRLLATRMQLERVGEQIEQIIAGSRPRCPLCGTPLTGGAHFCPHSNGHAHLTEA